MARNLIIRWSFIEYPQKKKKKKKKHTPPEKESAGVLRCWWFASWVAAWSWDFTPTERPWVLGPTLPALPRLISAKILVLIRSAVASLPNRACASHCRSNLAENAALQEKRRCTCRYTSKNVAWLSWRRVAVGRLKLFKLKLTHAAESLD